MTKDFDFKADKPSWPLSSYGPAKHEKNLLPPLDESPEELRLKAVTAMRNGNTSEYVRTLLRSTKRCLDHVRKLQHEQNAFANAEQVFMNVRNDIKSAFEAAKRHSLGTDTPSGSSTAFSVGQPSVFGTQGSGSASAFGQQQGTSAFGTPAFGAPAFGQTPSFGQSSIAKPAFGGAATNSGGFSAFAGPGPSAFATAATNPTTSPGSVFGQPAFGSSGGGPQPGQSAFGATNPTSPNSGFARPSPLGSTSGSGFGQTSPFNVTNNASSAFGQPPPTAATPFAQTTATSIPPTASPFGQPTPSTSAFGQSTSVFGQPTAVSAFGQPSPVFGTAPAQPQQSAFGQAMSPVSQGGPTGAPKPHAKSTAPDFANAKSTYRPGSDPYDSLLPANYSSLLPDNVRAAFAASRFSWDNVPDWIPPLDMR
jgi:nucleoporin NUP42